MFPIIKYLTSCKTYVTIVFMNIIFCTIKLNNKLSFPHTGYSCESGGCRHLDGHGPPEQECAREWLTSPPGVKGESVF